MSLVALLVLASFLAPQKDVLSEPPALGTAVPKVVMAARRGLETCLTSTSHYDPCAQVSADHTTYVVAWDKATGKVVYVFTADLSFVTDSELGVGGTTRVDRRKLLTYKSWLIAPEVADTANGDNGGNKWYPVVSLLDFPSTDANLTYASIVGFVQSDRLLIIIQEQATKRP